MVYLPRALIRDDYRLTLVILSALGKVNVLDPTIYDSQCHFYLCYFRSSFCHVLFIGVSRLTMNIWNILNTGENIHEFESAPMT